MSNTVTRYSDAELAEFKVLIEGKIAKTQEQLDALQEQIQDITENTSDDHGVDWVDDSSVSSGVEMLNNMAIRQRRYLTDLQNALIRIRNKSYGICVLTGELIDKKRLMAVPTTTKSLAAKTASQSGSPGKPKAKPKPKSSHSNTEKKIITKVIRKPSGNSSKPVIPDDEDADDLDFENELLFDAESDITPPIDDLEEIAEDMEEVEDKLLVRDEEEDDD